MGFGRVWRGLTVVACAAFCLAMLPTAPAAIAADATPAPLMPGRHVYDNGKLLSPRAVARAEELAADIESLGGGRVAVGTDEFMAIPSSDEYLKAWSVDGLLFRAYDVMGETTLGPTLRARLDAETIKYVEHLTPGPQTVESWVTSELARVDARLRGTHVFDGFGLRPETREKLEAAAQTLSAEIGAPVYVDVAIAESGPEASADEAQTAAFFNGADLASAFDRSLVIALGVSEDGKLGGYTDSDSDLWDAYETGGPWSMSTLSTRSVGDIDAAVLDAVNAVHKTPDPVDAAAEAAAAVTNAVRGFFSDRTNLLASGAGLAFAVFSLAAFAWVRRRRRHEAGYGDDDSVLAAGPPADMTPALASVVTSPLDSTRAITTALLDLAAHGRIAFYEEESPAGRHGAIRVVDGIGTAPHDSLARPLGDAERGLLRELVAEASKRQGGYIPAAEIATLRAAFDRTAEALHDSATRHGWLTLQKRSVSRAWWAFGLAELLGGAAMLVAGQPVAFAGLGVAGIRIANRAGDMPLPLRTRSGEMTEAMIDAYRRTLRHVLASPSATRPGWIETTEEATLWGYALGLEADIQSFVKGTVEQSMTSVPALALEAAGLAAGGAVRPVGLDPTAIAETLGIADASRAGGDAPRGGGDTAPEGAVRIRT